jgi:PEP-CTERM motif
MKRLTKTALMAAGVALIVQGAYAGPNNNDLILDINFNPTGSTEFNANLGLLSSFTSDMSSLLTGFSGYASFSQSGLNVGVVGGQNGQGGLSGTGNDVYMTTLHGSGAPTVGNPGKAAIASAGGVAGGFQSYGNAISSSDSASFSVNVASTPTANGSFANTMGANPLSQMTGSTISLDLWSDTVTGSSTTSGWVYQGELTLNLTSPSSPTLSFTAAAVPEPSTYGLIAGAGLLAVSLRRQLFPRA